MRRGKLGDVYAMHLPNGIKIIQWAYTIPKYGHYVRVFDGLYETVPENINQIVHGDHSYIIAFSANVAYRIGLVEFLENISVPEKYPRPMYSLEFHCYGRLYEFDVTIVEFFDPTSKKCTERYTFENLTSIDQLPDRFRNVKTVAGFCSASLIMYLFDYNFTLERPRYLWPYKILGEKADEILNGYQERIDRLREADKARRSANKKQFKTASS